MRLLRAFLSAGRMRVLSPLLAFLICGSTICAERYGAVPPGRELKTLAITTISGTVEAPFTEANQESFGRARISSDGKTIGWLAEVANCCTSYPLPLALVIFRDGKVIYRFREATAIWRWTFLARGTQVAYQWTFPHGFVPTYYTLRSLETGSVLNKFVCRINESTHEYIKPERIPDWVRAVRPALPCPGN